MHEVEQKQGQVTALTPHKGYGFILGVDGVEYFFHVTEVMAGQDAFLALGLGDHVVFQALQTTKGWRAVKVRREEG